MTTRRFLLSACTLVLASCSQQVGIQPQPAQQLPATVHRAAVTPEKISKKKIQHVVIIIQENRSFDNFFNGFPGEPTLTQAPDSEGQEIPLAIVPLANPNSVDHNLSDYLNAYDNGKMDGFDREVGGGSPHYYAYETTQQSDVQTYWDMAEQYVLDDNHFPSSLDASFVAHQYLIASQAGDAVNIPTSTWGCGPGYDEVDTITQQRTIGPSESPCFDYNTLADELDAKKLSWRYYAPAVTVAGGVWSAYQAINHIYQSGNGPEWLANVISPETQVLDLGPDGTLPAVTWVVPSENNSDHPGNNMSTGPSWVASVVNEIGQSQYWNNTVIFLLWDDWGGLYDHVPPPQKDFDGLGIRTPLLCISPYAYKGKISHIQYESASILRFIEDNFGLKPMGAADARATSAGKGCLDEKQAPRAFQPFAAMYPKEYLKRQPPDYKPPDTDF